MTDLYRGQLDVVEEEYHGPTVCVGRFLWEYAQG
jgi:hypothetical protein